jgi:hypothetical protein
MNNLRNQTILVAAILLLFGTLLGAGKADYSGKWKLNIEKSEFGTLPAPYEVTINISHAEPKLDLDLHQSSMQGDLDAVFTLTTDGKESNYQVGGGDVSSVMTWEGESLKLISDIYFQGMDIRYEDIWSLSEDNTTLTIKRDMSSSMGDTSQVLIFEKQ